jgi:hypothetical protein
MFLSLVRAAGTQHWVTDSIAEPGKFVPLGGREIVLLSISGFFAILIQIGIRMRSYGYKIYPSTLAVLCLSVIQSS